MQLLGTVNISAACRSIPIFDLAPTLSRSACSRRLEIDGDLGSEVQKIESAFDVDRAGRYAKR